MASLASEQIRALFRNGGEPVDTSLEAQRQAWEAAVEATNLKLAVTVTPVDLAGLSGEWIADANTTEAGVLLFLHGGGYNAGSCKTHRNLAAHLVRAAQAPVLLVDYRLAPEHPCPAAVEDAAQAYQALLRQGFSARQIVIGGDSAGGGLVMATLLKLRDDNLPLPAAAFLISPWLDLALTGDSIQTRAQVDPLTSHKGLYQAAQYYLGNLDPKHPFASPLYGDLHNLPPLLIHVGDHELLLSDSIRLAEKARAAGVQVQLEIWEEMWHVWHAWADDLPEGQEAIGRLAEFVRRQLS